MTRNVLTLSSDIFAKIAGLNSKVPRAAAHHHGAIQFWLGDNWMGDGTESAQTATRKAAAARIAASLVGMQKARIAPIKMAILMPKS